MQIVVDIPEKEFGIDINDKFQDFFQTLKVEIKEHLVNGTELAYRAYELETVDMFLKAFKNGTPLPKGHGDLIDRGKLKTHLVGTEQGTDLEVYLEPTIMNAPTIIEANKAEREE